jgi:hypothetical protein
MYHYLLGAEFKEYNSETTGAVELATQGPVLISAIMTYIYQRLNVLTARDYEQSRGLHAGVQLMKRSCRKTNIKLVLVDQIVIVLFARRRYFNLRKA